MAATDLTVTEEWIREKLQLHHEILADVRTLCLPGNIEGKISHLGISLKNFVRLKTLDLSYNALVTVSGLEHLKKLEKLNLYFNKISAFQEVMTLSKLKSLKEVDLRLNPLVKNHPEYRLHLVHSLCQLRKLDDCPVRDRERKAAIMNFTSDVELEHKKASYSTRLPDQRTSDLRLAGVHRLTKSLTLRDGNEETAMINHRNRPQTSPSSLSQRETESLPVQEMPDEVIYLVNNYDPDLYLQKMDSLKPAFRRSLSTDACRAQPCSQPGRKSSLPDSRPSGLGANRASRVTFADGYVQGDHSLHPLPASQVRKPSQLRVPAVPVFTADPRATSSGLGHSACADQSADVSPPAGQRALAMGDLSSDPPAPHLPCSSADGPGGPEPPAAATHKGSCRKPLELLHSAVREHWTAPGKNDLQHYKAFFKRVVQILSLMEQELASGEREAQALREEASALGAQAEEERQKHSSEVQELSSQLEDAHNSIASLDEQLRVVLEENVCLQRQLVKLERGLLSSRINQLTSSSTDNGP